MYERIGANRRIARQTENTVMTRSITCPQCGVPTVVTDEPASASGDAVCAHCGVRIVQDRQGVPRVPTVLCIDDDPLVLHFYREFLDRNGYRVLTATDGLLGVALAQRERPDVILLDVLLRGLSGFDICRKFRADPAVRHIPIILLTAWHESSVIRTGQEAGATLTIFKPEDPETIVAILAQVLSRPAEYPETGS